MKLTLGSTKPPIKNPRGPASTPSAVSDRPGVLLYTSGLRTQGARTPNPARITIPTRR
jgi:hypothetical protein